MNRKALGVKYTLTLISYEALPIAAFVIHYASGGFGTVNVIGFSVTLVIVIYFAGIQSELSQQIRQQELALTESRVAVMFSQIQPHFLYNSLVVIRHLCRENPRLAEETVVEFAQYLRVNLDSLTLKAPVPFEQELQHTQTYLAIEQKRFGYKLKVMYNIQFKDFSLPALTLQPIAENAVQHGVTQNKRGGTVTITAEEAEGNAVITVIDDGVGFVPGQPPQDGRSHVGIENVRSRLAALCGGSLEIQSKSGEGTTAVITIPKKKSNA
jgi:sensor histidine kinase YesM